MAEDLIRGEDGLQRCFWGAAPPEYVTYHDDEWGRPTSDDHRLFEKICLEGFQSGLSWLTILRKRENFRAAFAGFDFAKVARFGEDDVARLLQDAGIVRHGGKIRSVINNAAKALEMKAGEGSLAAFFWRYEPDKKSQPKKLDREALKAAGPASEAVALSKELKRRGWTFVGPTTVYAFMQAMGLVNDLIAGCHCRAEVDRERRAFQRPAGRLNAG
jgi:DNA-3-methyladenine glycosylase I